MKRAAGAGFLLLLLLGSLGATTARAQQLVRVKPGFATVIICPSVPDFVTVGNTQQFSVENSGTFILVKPLVSTGSTNMFIKAGADSFHLILRAAETPDLEVRLGAPLLASKSGTPTMAAPPRNGVDKPAAHPDQPRPRLDELRAVLLRARAILPAYLRRPRPYTYSVEEASIVLAVDYMIQIRDKMFVLATMINNSNIPYDIGYVRFRLINQASSYLFFSKTIKETELEPFHEVYNERIEAKSRQRLLFIFDKLGFSSRSKFEIKFIEASGGRDIAIEVPGSYVD